MKQILKELRIRMSGNFPAIVEVLEGTVPSKDIHLIAIRLYCPHSLRRLYEYIKDRRYWHIAHFFTLQRSKPTEIYVN